MVIKALRLAMIGILISLSSSYTVMTLQVLAKPGATMSGEELLIQLILAVILGIVIGLVSLIFESERIEFSYLLMIHFVVITVSVFIFGYFGGWYNATKIGSIISLLLSIGVIYCMSWGITKLLLKRDIKEMNELIQKRRQN